MVEKTKDAQGFTAFQCWWHELLRMPHDERAAIISNSHKLAETAWDASEQRFHPVGVVLENLDKLDFFSLSKAEQDTLLLKMEQVLQKLEQK